MCYLEYGTLADWLVALGTIVLAVVALFQDTFRGWFYRPIFKVSTRTEPPDCVAVPITLPSGIKINSVYLRLWVENVGNATARNAEVFAKELRRRRTDGAWELVNDFPPMNLKWANVGLIYFPNIAPHMGKHCDLAHVADPAMRNILHEDAPNLHLSAQQPSLAFDLTVAPNHKGHIIGPGEYRLDILVAAENARPTKRRVTISLTGTWYSNGTTMLRDGVGVAVDNPGAG